MQEQWQACVDRMSGQLSAQAHRTYIRPLVCLGFDAASGVLRLGAPSQMKLNIVRDQFGRNIDDAVQLCFEQPVTVHYEVIANDPPPAPGNDADDDDEVIVIGAGADSRLDAGRSGPANTATGKAFSSSGDSPAKKSAGRSRVGSSAAPEKAGPSNPGNNAAGGFGALGARAPDDRTRLLPDATFATFVTGKANELARAAASKVAERPGTAFNPLFIYGGVGLGKTHLMHAVGNAFLERQPNASVRYVSANQFFQDMVQAHQPAAHP